MSVRAEDVSACLVTRGDVDLVPILESLPFTDVIVWNNAQRPEDKAAYGRYLAIHRARNRIVFVQDDDCVLPVAEFDKLLAAYQPGILTALMPPDRTDYTDSVLIGWGAIFDSYLPDRAFAEYSHYYPIDTYEFFKIGADFVFPILTPCQRIDGEHDNLPWAHGPNRTWGQPGYDASKAEFLRQAREVRDGR